VIAGRVGDDARAATYRAAGEGLRAAIATRLTDGDGAIASNLEELASGEGYWDAAVLDAIAMGLFDPAGKIATATLAGLDEHLRVDAGPGWSRNDDRWDHANADDLSPWGGEYDSAEWVVTDLRGAVALRMAGETGRSAALIEWVTAQTAMNYGMVAETYDEVAGTYKFNAPMLGFGAGALALALADRAAGAADPACGAYFDEGEASTTSGTTSATGDTGGETGAGVTTAAADETGVAPTTAAAPTSGGVGATFETADESQGSVTPQDEGTGCGCRGGGGGVGLVWLPLLLVRSRRRRG
jgi:GH15 family glucan-1,4-alpha-glucosidase